MIPDQTEINSEPIFTLLRFNPRRAMRGAPAAEVEFQSGGDCALLWMTEKDIRDNIEDFGEHHALLQALQAYKDRKEFPER